MQRPIESVMYNDNVDTSTLSDGRDTISQSELTGLTECDVSICDASDDDFFRDEEWPIPEHMVIPSMAADNVNMTARDHTHYTVGGKCIHHQHIMDAGNTLREFDALKQAL